MSSGDTDIDTDGELRVGLFGQGSSGQTYRLRDALFAVDGPGGSADLDTEALTDTTSPLSAVLTEGDYTIDLQDGWRVERAGANSSWQEVVASLVSQNPAQASVLPQSTTNVTYTFSIDGEAVPFDQGTLEIDVEFSDTDAACPDANNDGFCDFCGDQEITPGEECDGSNLDGTSCTQLGFLGGTLACSPSCTLDTSGCTNCGNGVLDPGEQCEPPNQTIQVTPCGPAQQFCFEFEFCDSTCNIVTDACSCSPP